MEAKPEHPVRIHGNRGRNGPRDLGSADRGGFDLKIGARVVLEDVKLGDSISVNGTCLTVTDFDAEEFTVGLSPETLRKTSLEELERGSPVNLERALQPVSRMGGHVVHGHVDGTGVIVSMEVEGDSLWVKESCFDFMLVAYTQQKVVIPTKKIGQEVNLEVDIMGKYVERLLTTVGFSMNKPQDLSSHLTHYFCHDKLSDPVLVCVP
ncbi:hypothetical protein Bca101_029556 [Brassica carinata]